MQYQNTEQRPRACCCIDLKSYYASCETIDRRLDPLTTNLVVADASRTDSTICLAVSPSLKAFGIPGRPRLFEVKQKVEQINAERLRAAVRCGKAGTKDGKPCLIGESFDAHALAADPSLALSLRCLISLKSTFPRAGHRPLLRLGKSSALYKGSDR